MKKRLKDFSIIYTTGTFDVNKALIFNEELEHKKINLIYYLDPTNCFCWGFEPILKRLILEYGEYFNIILKIGGIIEEYDLINQENKDFTEIKNYWINYGNMSGMSISGKIWDKSPILTSIPTSKGFLASQRQGSNNSMAFLRRLMENLFIYDIDISDNINLFNIAKETDMFLEKFIFDYSDESTTNDLLNQLLDAKSIGVDLLPTILFVGENDIINKVSGLKSYDVYKQNLFKTLNFIPKKRRLCSSVEEVFNKYDTLSTFEITQVTTLRLEEILISLRKFVENGYLQEIKIGSHSYWKKAAIRYKKL